LFTPTELKPTVSLSIPSHPVAGLTWSVHLAAAAPRRAATVGLVILLSGALAGWLFQGPLPALGVAFALLNAVAEFLFPITYRLSPHGAEMRCFLTRRAIAWSDVRRVYHLPDGLKLSPLERPGRREPFRGLLLRLVDNEAQVMDSVRGHTAALGARCTEAGSQ
jgi:hypothetical protein